jgi:hypothetical protein
MLFELALSAVNPALSAPLVNEFWISPQVPALGLLLGTMSNPLDGSTVAKFDAAMLAMPSHALIHLAPGTFQAMGDHGWGPKRDKIWWVAGRMSRFCNFRPTRWVPECCWMARSSPCNPVWSKYTSEAKGAARG